MEASPEQMEAQLKLWSSRIFDLAAETQTVGARTGFDDLMHIDELKALYAIAQLKLDELMAAQGGTRKRIRGELTTAWSELDAAFRKRTPGTPARTRGREADRRSVGRSADGRQEH
jgi:hypothetical protein